MPLLSYIETAKEVKPTKRKLGLEIIEHLFYNLSYNLDMRAFSEGPGQRTHANSQCRGGRFPWIARSYMSI